MNVIVLDDVVVFRDEMVWRDSEIARTEVRQSVSGRRVWFQLRLTLTWTIVLRQYSLLTSTRKLKKDLEQFQRSIQNFKYIVVVSVSAGRRVNTVSCIANWTRESWLVVSLYFFSQTCCYNYWLDLIDRYSINLNTSFLPTPFKLFSFKLLPP